MRDCFVSELTALASEDRRIVLITGDLGFGVLDRFARELPDQFLNAGVAEQNMTGIATGLALEGHVVFTYSIANFPTLRCLEQIRNDVCYHDADVKVVAIGGGFSYGALGMSHHATEDLAILRAVPGISVFAPCDDLETRELTRHLAMMNGPAYLRLDKSKVDPLVGADEFRPGRLRCLREGGQVAMLSCGGVVAEALKASDLLAGAGIGCSVYSAHTLKPFDVEGFLEVVGSHNALVTIEEHVRNGGLGTIAAEALVDAGVMPKAFLRLALPDKFCSIVGSQEYLRAQLGLDAQTVYSKVKALFDSRDQANV